MYNNRFQTRMKCTLLVRQQLNNLKTALAIGRILDRIVILPVFRCCQPEHRSQYDCPLNSLVAILPFDSQFSTKYREHSFLRHSKVPASIRNGKSAQQSIRTDASSTNTMIVWSLDIMLRFNHTTDKVLSLGPLERIVLRFLSAEEQATFNKAVFYGIKQSTYHQSNMVRPWAALWSKWTHRIFLIARLAGFFEGDSNISMPDADI